MAFHCAIPSTALDLCFNGGICVIVNGSEQCLCTDASWGHDVFAWHTPNCTFPLWWDVFLFNFLLSLVLGALIVAICLKMLPTLRSSARALALTVVAIEISFCFGCLSRYLQRGSFEGAAIFDNVTLMLISVNSYHVWYRIAQPVYDVAQQSTKQMRLNLSLVVAFYLAFFFITCIYMLVKCRDPVFSPEYNIAIVVALFATFMNGCFVFVGIWVHISRLRALLLPLTLTDLPGAAIAPSDSVPAAASSSRALIGPSEARRRGFQNMIIRLNSLRRAIAIGGIIILPGMATAPIIFLAVSSFPYSWVFYLVAFQANHLLSLGVVLFVRMKTEREQSTPIATGTNGDEMIGAVS